MAPIGEAGSLLVIAAGVALTLPPLAALLALFFGDVRHFHEEVRRVDIAPQLVGELGLRTFDMGRVSRHLHILEVGPLALFQIS